MGRDKRTQVAMEDLQQKEVEMNSLGLVIPEQENLSELRKREVARMVEAGKQKEREELFIRKIMVENKIVPERTGLQLQTKYADLWAQMNFKKVQLSSGRIVERNDKLEGGKKLEHELRNEIRWISFELAKIVEEAQTWGISEEELQKYVNS